MTDVRIEHHNNTFLKPESVAPEDIEVIGCIGTWDARTGRFPKPLLGIKNHSLHTSNGSLELVSGFLASDRGEFRLIKGHGDGKVTLTDGRKHGLGSVVLGQDNPYPCSSWGLVIEEPVPYVGSHELGFVREPGEQEVLATIDIKDKGVGHLVYAESSVLDGLYRLHNQYRDIA